MHAGDSIPTPTNHPMTLPVSTTPTPTSTTTPKFSAPHTTTSTRRDELNEHFDTVVQLQRDLENDAEELCAQEGWDPATAAAALDWAGDRGMVFRALRRNHFDANKTLSFLLTALLQRVEHGLAGAIPPPPLPLWSLMPLPHSVDRLGRPMAVLTLRHVSRDSDGSLAELKQWVWWGLELVRRALRDYWVDQRRGTGAEGAVLLVDAEGAGYRNMEVELLPTLFSVGHSNFPGLFESVFVVNAGWSHRVMWNSVIRRVLPKSALDRVSFLDSRNQVEDVVDPDVLPQSYGGDAEEVDPGAMFRRYSHARHHAPSRGASRSTSRANSRANSRSNSRAPSRAPSLAGTRASSQRGPSRHASSITVNGHANGHAGEYIHISGISRTTSASSIADVYFTAPASPATSSFSTAPSRGGSRAGSRRGSISGRGRDRELAGLAARLAMTKSHADVQTAMRDGDDQADMSPARQGTHEVVQPTVPQQGPIQRIKSLSDFHLYLSPSRLANRDLLSDSDSDEPSRPVAPSAVQIQRRRTLQPAIIDPRSCSLAERRAAARAAEQSEAISPGTPRDMYASKLQEHHARWLDHHRSDADALRDSASSGVASSPSTEDDSSSPSPETDVTVATPDAEVVPDDTALVKPAPPELNIETNPEDALLDSRFIRQPVSAPDAQYSGENPWFGYPVVRVPDNKGEGYTIRPRYGRNRKRDLVKTLLWLFLMRIQSWRDGLERALGLNRLRVCARAWSSSAPAPRAKSANADGYEGDADDDDDSGEWRPALTPTSGLARTARRRAALRRAVPSASAGTAIARRWAGDWVWMVIGFLLLRGTWARMLDEPLEAVGLGGVREVITFVLGLGGGVEGIL